MDELQINLENNTYSKIESQNNKMKEFSLFYKDNMEQFEQQEKNFDDKKWMTYEQFKMNAIDKLSEKFNNKYGKKNILK